MTKLINFFLEVENVCRSLPRKFLRHCWNLFRFMAVWVIGKMVLDGWQQHFPLEHYTLISVGFYLVLALAAGWFVWRAYVGMERDHDFYIED